MQADKKMLAISELINGKRVAAVFGDPDRSRMFFAGVRAFFRSTGWPDELEARQESHGGTFRMGEGWLFVGPARWLRGLTLDTVIIDDHIEIDVMDEALISVIPRRGRVIR